MTSLLLLMPSEAWDLVVAELDFPSMHNLGRTNRVVKKLVVSRAHQMRLSGPLPNTMNLAPISTAACSEASSPASSDDSHDCFGSSDTDMTSPEPEWEFQMTPDVKARLALLPNFKNGATLCSLPTELQLLIFEHMDPIDSACLALSNRRSYGIFCAIHGTKMPLNTRRPGPNPMERAWEAVGKRTCSHCGNYRCQLYEHIKSWMPEGLEYCQLTQKFGSKAEDGARETCYRGKPSKPNRCGRHPIRSTTRHQDDPIVVDTNL